MHPHPHRSKRVARKGERGVALVFATFAIAALLVAITAALVTGAANSKASWNYKGASQAHFVAESGLSDALQNINGTGVINYQTDIVNAWGTRFGTGPKTFAPLGGFSYQVTTTAGLNPANDGRLIASATGPDGLRNVVVANIHRDDKPSTAPGAIYLATDSNTNSTFNGNNFIVDGNDHNYTGGMGPGLAVPGISTRNDTNTQEAVGSLNGSNVDNVLGYGFQAGPPVVPAISTSPSAPTIAQMNQFITDLTVIAATHIPPWPPCPCTQVNNSCSCAPYGDELNPKITLFPSPGVTIQNAGNVSGAGVMIVDGDLSVQGTIDFKGLILVRGTIRVQGNATIYGSIWAQGVDMQVGGSAIVYNSSQALSLANQIVPSGAIPTPVEVVSMADCAELPTGTGGCP